MGDVMGRHGRRLLVLAALAAPLALATGCGGSARTGTTSARTRATAQFAKERATFHVACGACHTLADAHTRGTAADGEANFDQIRPNVSSVENYLEHRIGKMPEFRIVFTRPEIAALARYVATADGCGTRSPTGCD